MTEAGETPPGIRDIEDKLSSRAAHPAPAKLTPAPKVHTQVPVHYDGGFVASHMNVGVCIEMCVWLCGCVAGCVCGTTAMGAQWCTGNRCRAAVR